MNEMMINVSMLAQADGGSPTGLQAFLGNPIMLMVLMVVIFYFLLIRPQQKQRKQHQQMVSALKTGDRVVLSGGIHGTVANVKDRTLIVKIAENTKIEVDRASVGAVLAGNAE